MPKDVVSRYAIARSKESPSGSTSSYDSGALDNDKMMVTSDAPERNNFYKFKNDADAKEAFESMQAENEMRAGMKKGGKVSSASKRADGIAKKGKTKGRFV